MTIINNIYNLIEESSHVWNSLLADGAAAAGKGVANTIKHNAIHMPAGLAQSVGKKGLKSYEKFAGRFKPNTSKGISQSHENFKSMKFKADQKPASKSSLSNLNSKDHQQKFKSPDTKSFLGKRNIGKKLVGSGAVAGTGYMAADHSASANSEPKTPTQQESNTPTPTKTKSPWKTDSKGHVAGTKLTSDQYDQHLTNKFGADRAAAARLRASGPQ